MRICNVVGARPNFMKIAPIVHEMKKRKMPHFVVHTGQHYDRQMSQVFFEEFGVTFSGYLFRGWPRVPCGANRPHYDALRTGLPGTGNHPARGGGDVNSTLACALTAAKLGIPVAHVEAGLRSFDRSMPEEINRLVTDHISDLLFTTEASANNNLNNEGIAEDLIHFVGNCMIDSLLGHLDLALQAAPWHHFGFDPGSYALLTLHRPANVDDGRPWRIFCGSSMRFPRSCRFCFPCTLAPENALPLCPFPWLLG